MTTKNENSTRFYSDKQEKQICKLLGASQQINSGASKFSKGDCVQKEANMLIEAKTITTNKDSFSVKKEWLDKNEKEAKTQRLYNYCLAFNFGPDQPNYFIINERLMKYLVDKLKEEE